MVWTTTLQTPQYRLKCEERVTSLLQCKRGENECVSITIGDPKMVRKYHSSKCKVHRDSVRKFQKRRQQLVQYMTNASENEDDKGRNEIWGQYTVVQLKGELFVLFGGGGNKKHKCKADWPEMIPEKPKLWCTNHVKRVWWNVPEKVTQSGRVLKSVKLKNVTNGLKASEKVRKGCRSEREHCRVL